MPFTSVNDVLSYVNGALDVFGMKPVLGALILIIIATVLVRRLFD